MRELTTKETIQLGKDLNQAKINVLIKWGFTISEIANIMGFSESTIRAISKTED